MLMPFQSLVEIDGTCGWTTAIDDCGFQGTCRFQGKFSIKFFFYSQLEAERERGKRVKSSCMQRLRLSKMPI